MTSAARTQRLLIAGGLTFALAWLAQLGACSDDLGDEPSGQSITGEVIYSGEAHASFGSPQLTVAAFTVFPPQGPPHASQTILDPDFSSPIVFELEFLQPHDYFVVAQLSDGDDPANTAVPSGAWPDMCVLSAASGNVSITEDAGHSDLDITLYDNGGIDDPCDDPGNEQPEDSVRVAVTSNDITPAEGDSLTVALFPSFPPAGPPAHFGQAALSEFPATVTVTNVAAGEHYLSVCYDSGGDNLQCDGEGDLLVWYDEGASTVTMEEGGRVSLDVSLDGEEVDDQPEDSVRVTVTSSEITPGDADMISVALFGSFPPAGAPAAFAMDPLTAFPVDVTVTSVAEGDYYVSVCYDQGGGNFMCDGEGDVLVYYADGEETVTMEEGGRVALDVSLDDQGM